MESLSARRDAFGTAWGEVTGAVGDAVTVLPIVVAVAALTDLTLGRLLLGFAVFQVVWGVWYGHPMSVEPMKALAALVIAGGLSAGEYLAAGLLAGGVLLVVGRAHLLDRVSPYVGEPVIRGIQVGVALLLLQTGVTTGLENLPLAALSVGVAAVAVALGYRNVAALAVLGVGSALAVDAAGTVTPRLPSLAVTLPAFELTRDAAGATLAQLAMTVGNAAVATSLLVSDYFDGDATADDLSTSMGAMNLLAVPLGAMPMCHGSGGLAGKYAFGARTATSNLVLGGFYLLLAVVAVDAVAAFPMAVLGVVLALVAIELGRAGLDTDDPLVTGGVAVLAVLANVGVAFLAGVVGYHALRRVRD
jgi:hypothetical protein